MSLRSDAVQLSRVLNEIVRIAQNENAEYVAKLAASIAPVVERYDYAVFDLHSREQASEALTEMAESMSDLSAAAATGEIPGFQGNSLNSDWRLYTIFRESKYRDEAL